MKQNPRFQANSYFIDNFKLFVCHLEQDFYEEGNLEKLFLRLHVTQKVLQLPALLFFFNFFLPVLLDGPTKVLFA